MLHVVAYFADKTKRTIATHETHDEEVSVEELHKTNVEVASVKESNPNDDPAPCTIGKDESEGRLLAVGETFSVF